MKFKSFYQNLILISFSLALTILFVELLYNYFFRKLNNEYFCHKPNIRELFYPSAGIFPGIKDSSLFTSNSRGFRGRELDKKVDNFILTLGGSTTECVYLDDTETWPSLLEYELNEIYGSNLFQVINAGKSGINSNHHVQQLKIFLENYDFIDMVIVLQGINDLQYSLGLDKKYKRKTNNEYLRESFSILPDSSNPLIKSLLLYNLYNKIKGKFINHELEIDVYGNNYRLWRKNRKVATRIIEKIPELTQSFKDFKNNIIAQIEIAKRYNKEIIFLTQPTIWHKNISNKLKNLCWFGWIGRNQNQNTTEYYSITILEILMERYNRILIDVCKNNNIQYIDLASKLSKDISVFFDDCHFNESGAREVTSRIVKHFEDNRSYD